ncbi:MAG: metal-dependent hydrolase [Rubrivivax sp.]|nr:metal-dependent hydrolase [Rubrivivax sp.]MDP3223743.1 metal-dependent hydrolase [Rubrivivax sp.]MDP3614385.1 metal-dependent hydrolase [Rubrivivax sp.]
MDSLSQLVLGAAVSVAVMQRRTAVWKAAAWGAVAGTLPDLDVVLDHGDPILNMVLHRAETHSLFWLTLFSLPLAAAVARLHGEWAQWKRWWLALWLVLVTHPLLDAITVYGTQLLLPFSDRPLGVGSMFIIDPLYTLPLLVGVLWVVFSRGSRVGLRANTVGLVLSCTYLVWSVAAQQHVTDVARAALARQGVTAQHLLVTPTGFTTLLWRVVAVDGDSYHEGFHALLDAPGTLSFERFKRGNGLAAELQDNDRAQRIQRFSQGLYKLHADGDRLLVTDLRMGIENNYSFSFVVAQRQGGVVRPVAVQQQGSRVDVSRALDWAWRRMWGEQLPPPR